MCVGLAGSVHKSEGQTEQLSLPAPLPWENRRTVPIALVAAERPQALPCFGGVALPLWTFMEGAWPPVVRIEIGDTMTARFENRLPMNQGASIHWHGIRVPNRQDGVPHLVQPIVQFGEVFQYEFAPPDTGTFFFHTHCNTAEQLGRGLLGVLIVDGDATRPFDHDMVLVARDWHVDRSEGKFGAFFSLRGAGRAGTYGNVRSINGMENPRFAVRSEGLCRLRLINADPTRIMRISIAGTDAAILALDGVAVPPFQMSTLDLAPAMRADVAIIAPREGKTVELIDLANGERVVLAGFVGTGDSIGKGRFAPEPLRGSRIPEPDLANAIPMTFRFQRTDQGGVVVEPSSEIDRIIMDSLCLSAKDFWTINGEVWPSKQGSAVPPPMATLQLGRTYRITLINESSFSHPIHVHGHTFTVLRQSRQSLPPHKADTVLLLPNETVEVAFVADNPGDWMLHCHVIEHQETGMMAYFRVS